MMQSSSDESTVALHLHNGLWSRVPVPTALWNVFTVSADDAWASSSFDGLYHWDGTRWNKAPGTEAIDGLGSGSVGIYMLSATEGWAVSGKHLLHFTHGHWIDVSNLIPNDIGDVLLHSLSMASADDGWAVGSNGILHYDGKVWKRVESPLTPNQQEWVDLTGVAMVSHDEGWAVGRWYGEMESKSVILHYVGGRWTLTDGNVDGDLKTLAMVSPDEGWAATPRIARPVTVGNVYTAVNEGAKVFHYKSGHWVVERVPGEAAIEQISMDSPDDGWALTYGGLLHYHGGVWEQFSQ